MKIPYHEDIQKLTLLDDIFMSIIFADDAELTEFTLKIILNLDLKVTSVRSQEPLTNLQGRSVRLDIHAISADGKHFNIEIQRQDRGAAARRARYNSSMLDANTLLPGENFDSLPETYVIFITERDVLKLNEPIYFIERTILGKNKLFNDGSHIVYVNNTIQDDTPLGKLMHDFACVEPDKMFYEIFAEKISRHKNPKQEDIKVSRVIEELIERAKRETTEQVKRETNMARKLIADGELALEKISELCNLPIETVRELAAAKVNPRLTEGN